MKKFISFISTFIICFGLYFMLTFSNVINIQEIITGGIIAAIIAGVTSSVLIKEDGLYLLKKGRIIFLIKYILIYPYYLLKANLGVAKIALSPRIKIKPAIVKVNTDLRSDYGVAMLANSITLTPGTITMDVIDYDNKTKLFVHCIDIDKSQLWQGDQLIKDDFERDIRRVFE